MAGHRKFIAGAVCPQCRKMDKLYIENDATVARCAACGHEMQQPTEADHGDANPAETSRAAPDQVADQAVSLVNFKNR